MSNSSIILQQNCAITKILKPTASKMFKNLKIGDRVHFSIELERVGVNRGKTYAPYIKCINLATNEDTVGTFNSLPKILSNFVWDSI